MVYSYIFFSLSLFTFHSFLAMTIFARANIFGKGINHELSLVVFGLVLFVVFRAETQNGCQLLQEIKLLTEGSFKKS